MKKPGGKTLYSAVGLAIVLAVLAATKYGIEFFIKAMEVSGYANPLG